MAAGDDIDHLTLFEMHNWMCCICDTKIDKSLRFPHPLAATVEHKIPLCKGGTHTWNNVAPAHAMCNFEKGDALNVSAIRGRMNQDD